MTRFCIICNYVSRLIPPIASRCAKFRFKPLPQEAMVERLQFICKEEGIHCPPAVLSELMARSEGAMPHPHPLRRVVTHLGWRSDGAVMAQ